MADDDKRADEETLPDTPLHAYGQGREEDVEGDAEKLKSGDPQESQREEISDGDEESNFPNADKH
ncbi:MAG: hypothetical protein QOK00_737 [Thermoleophilaceae bacterium]|jgi:hypothetical protein|nr:hypothetical protein [Thermoleophilaceae bacterium]MEA2400334.1 hypothetical protein [Thermoleophilaceae bacterium]MEA2454264.1 hypothetical protein [Thermoleophilaceae bacterium]